MINLQLTQSQYDSIMAAVTAYNENLMKALETQPKREIPFSDLGIVTVQEHKYGLKADGTPRKRPGRKPTRKARA
jgi:phosphopantetheinyl transferase (holo-ACP synthase)